ncbi:PEP-CTERM sorting domain-containing protein [Coraliomargarita sp. W4R72]
MKIPIASINRSIITSLAITLSLSAFHVQGAIIASESFDTNADGTGGIYSSGSVFGQDVSVGNTGFNSTNVWVNNTGAIKANASASFVLSTHSGITGSVGTTDGTALLTSGYDRNSNRELAVTPVTASSYYFSGITRLNGTTSLENGDKLAMGMMDSIGASEFDVSTGIHIGYSKDNDTNYLAAFAGGNTYNLFELVGGSIGGIYQVVLKLDVNAVGDDVLTAWYAFDGAVTLTEGLSATIVGDIWQDAGDLDTFTLQTKEGGTEGPQAARFDEMRFGTALSDVTSIAIPESSTYGMFFGSVAALLVLRRHRTT